MVRPQAFDAPLLRDTTAQRGGRIAKAEDAREVQYGIVEKEVELSGSHATEVDTMVIADKGKILPSAVSSMGFGTLASVLRARW